MNENPTHEEPEKGVRELEQVDVERKQTVKEVKSAKRFMDMVVDRSPFARQIVRIGLK